MDPRSFTVKPCGQPYAGNSLQKINRATNSRREFSAGLGKAGDLEVLNDIGASKLGSVLRDMASISNAIRVGCGDANHSLIAGNVDKGINWVLDKMGFSVHDFETLKRLDIGSANHAYGQLKDIISQVKSGKFSLSKIPGYLQDFQNLEKLLRGIYTPAQDDTYDRVSMKCDASPYPVDLIARAPKYPFLFIVQIIPNSGYQGLLTQDLGPLDCAFTVITASRPNIKFVYDNVNYYNYRTHVIMKRDSDELRFSVYDDTIGVATSFYNAMLRAMSPIASQYTGDEGIWQNNSHNYSKGILADDIAYKNVKATTNSSSTGLYAEDNVTPIKTIRVFHIHDYGHHMTIYHYQNPKLQNAKASDLDMQQSGPSTLDFSFLYDSVYIEENVDINNQTQYKLEDLQRGAVYQLGYNGTGDKVGNPEGFNPYGAQIEFESDDCGIPRVQNDAPYSNKTIKPTEWSTAIPSASKGNGRPVSGKDILDNLF